MRTMSNTAHLETELATLRDAYQSLSAYADEARVRERLEVKEAKIRELKASLAESLVQLENVHVYEEVLAALHGRFHQKELQITRLELRLAWQILTGGTP